MVASGLLYIAIHQVSDFGFWLFEKNRNKFIRDE